MVTLRSQVILTGGSRTLQRDDVGGNNDGVTHKR